MSDGGMAWVFVLGMVDTLDRLFPAKALLGMPDGAKA